jgi:hypothetical protein
MLKYVSPARNTIFVLVFAGAHPKFSQQVFNSVCFVPQRHDGVTIHNVVFRLCRCGSLFSKINHYCNAKIWDAPYLLLKASFP